MELRDLRALRTAKAGNRPEECEDAYAFGSLARRVGTMGVNTARIAVSDGASESAFARSWSHVLARAFVERPIAPPAQSATDYQIDQNALESWLAPGQQEWDGTVPWDRIPWHGEAKARAGALATLLGLTITSDAPEDGASPLSWEAVAIGDCCLFIVRGGELLRSFPMENAAQFNNTPVLICSNPANNRGLGGQVRQESGECAPGDLVLLATDALACWMLEDHAQGGKPWDTLLALDSHQAWEEWVNTQRQQRIMKNDDTTLVIIEVE